jgi:hypothetical protein
MKRPINLVFFCLPLIKCRNLGNSVIKEGKMVRKMNFDRLNETINKNRKLVNEQIVKERGTNRKKRNRTRSVGERLALDEIAIARWNKAMESGKIMWIGSNRMKYDYQD